MDAIRPVDSKIATAAKKVPLGAVAMRALYGVCRVFGFGRKKHGHGNFYNASMSDGAGERYVSGVLRHLELMQEPNSVWSNASLSALDEESGLPHIDHALAGLIMLRSILTKDGILPADPGEGKEPPK